MRNSVFGDGVSKSVSCMSFSVIDWKIFRIESLQTEYFIEYIILNFSEVGTAYLKNVSSTVEKRVSSRFAAGLVRHPHQSSHSYN